MIKNDKIDKYGHIFFPQFPDDLVWESIQDLGLDKDNDFEAHVIGKTDMFELCKREVEAGKRWDGSWNNISPSLKADKLYNTCSQAVRKGLTPFEEENYVNKIGKKTSDKEKW